MDVREESTRVHVLARLDLSSPLTKVTLCHVSIHRDGIFYRGEAQANWQGVYLVAGV